MTRIDALLGGRPTVSFEFFPPKTDAGRAQLARCLDELEAVSPSFVSVTYGAGGSTRETTRDLVIEIDGTRAFPAMPHLTCMGHLRSEIDALLDDYEAAGIVNVLALAGDPPADGSTTVGDFTYAAELVEVVRSRGRFSVAVAAFPEGHPRSASIAEDRRRLAEKLSMAQFGITQFFYRAEDYLRMRDDLAALGCETPVLPGVMPMLNPDVVRRFAAMNHAYFPEDLAMRIVEAPEADREAIAVEAAADLVAVLLAEGVPGIHVYCLNRAAPSLALLDRVGLSASSGTGDVP